MKCLPPPGTSPDGVTGATPLASGDAGLLDLFLGNVGGSLGETSALALLIGGVFLLVLGLISWHTLWHIWAVWQCWNCSIPSPPAVK